tara:strand:+ start:329 stop:625 length:297 start_codon:yes stop_codon:yes gene_type:complete
VFVTKLAAEMFRRGFKKLPKMLPRSFQDAPKVVMVVVVVVVVVMMMIGVVMTTTMVMVMMMMMTMMVMTMTIDTRSPKMSPKSSQKSQKVIETDWSAG